MKRILFILLVLSLIFLVGCAKEEEGAACTQDVKECPDGSFVPRVPPTCEFKECPVSEDYDGLDEALEELEEVENI